MSKITGRTYLYFFKKIILFLFEKINNKFSKNYTKIHLITDGASWAVDTSTRDILRYFDKTKFKTIISLFTPENQIVYYIDQYSILKNKFYDYDFDSFFMIWDREAQEWSNKYPKYGMVLKSFKKLRSIQWKS